MSTMRTFYEMETGVAVSALRRILALYLLTQTLSMQKGLRGLREVPYLQGKKIIMSCGILRQCLLWWHKDEAKLICGIYSCGHEMN